MKKSLTLFLSIALAGYAYSQCDDENLTSWDINTDFETAAFYKSCCPPTAEDSLIELTDTAGISEVWYNNNNVYIKTSSLARFTMGPWDTDKEPVAQESIFKIPRAVTKDESGDLNTAESGTIGLAVDGVILFGETTSGSYNNSDGSHTSGDGVWNEDAWSDEAWSMDFAAGHANGTGQYHYHSTPWELFGDISAGHSPIIGWGLDGVPIYGPYGYADSMNSNSPIVRIKSSYDHRNITVRTTLADGTVLDASEYGPDVSEWPLGTYVEDFEYSSVTGHLDEYNGRFCKTPEFPSGVYAYFVTIDAAGDPAYPYFIGPEYYGETAQNGGGNATIANNAEEFDPLTCITSYNEIGDNGIAFKAYPNPTTGVINLETSSEVSNGVSVVVTDVLGNQVFTSDNVFSGAEGVQIELPVQTGVYILRATVGEDVHVMQVVKK